MLKVKIFYLDFYFILVTFGNIVSVSLICFFQSVCSRLVLAFSLVLVNYKKLG